MHLYSFDSGFAEVSFHLNIDLYITNIAENKRRKMSPTIMRSKSCNTEVTVIHKPKEQWINLYLIYRSSKTCPLSFSVCALIPTTFMAWSKQKAHLFA